MQLLGQYRPPPFSDWLAQVQRQVLKLTGSTDFIRLDAPILRSCYDANLTPYEVARTWEEYTNG